MQYFALVTEVIGVIGGYGVIPRFRDPRVGIFTIFVYKPVRWWMSKLFIFIMANRVEQTKFSAY